MWKQTSRCFIAIVRIVMGDPIFFFLLSCSNAVTSLRRLYPLKTILHVATSGHDN